MTEWHKAMHAALASIKSELEASSDVVSELPTKHYLNQALTAVDDSAIDSLITVDQWVDDIQPVVDQHDCAHLREPLKTIGSNRSAVDSSPVYTQLVLTLLTLTLRIEVLQPETDFSPVHTPVQEAIDALGNDESIVQDRLLTATDATNQLSSQATFAQEALRGGTELTYVHPEENEQHLINYVQEQYKRGNTDALQTVATTVQRALDGVWTHDDIMSFDAKPFEHLLAELWFSIGYQTDVVKDRSKRQGGDQGIDVVATRTDDTQETVLIQAKRTSNQVGVKPVRAFMGTYPQWEPDKLFFVTTASISGPAHREANRFDKLFVVEGDDLVDILTKSSLPPPVLNGD